MASTTAAIGSASPATPNMGAIAFAGTLGTIIEWYDFLIYGTAAALVFNKLFFPTVTPLTGTLAALATYAVGFVARPVGGALFGYFGDRIGRKSMLMLTMFVMGLGTFLIGLLPTYGQIGIWAPALLVVLRFIQGIGLGGEWGGASLMVLEHAPSDRRGFYGSLVQVGFPLGLVTSSGVFAIVTLLPEDQFLAWGWRIPFLISIVLVALGAFIRARIPETPVFEAIKAKQDISGNPFFEAVFKNPRAFFVALGLKLSEVSWVYMLTVFVVVYATTKLALPRTLLLDAIFWAAVVEVATIPLFGYLTRQDRPSAVLFRRRDLHDRLRLPAVLAFGHEDAVDRHDGGDRRAQFRPRADVRARIGLLPRAVRRAGALQRRLVRLPGLGGDRRRLRPDHRHGAGRLHGRDRRRVGDADPARAGHPGRDILRP